MLVPPVRPLTHNHNLLQPPAADLGLEEGIEGGEVPLECCEVIKQVHNMGVRVLAGGGPDVVLFVFELVGENVWGGRGKGG